MLKTTTRGLAVIATLVATAGLSLSAPAQAEVTTGSIAGTVTDSHGAPAPAVSVFLSNADGTTFRYLSTDSAGHYQADELPPGNGYTSSFRMVWGGQVAGSPVSVVAGVTTTLDVTLPGVGSIAGHFRGTDGGGLGGVYVYAQSEGGSYHSTITAADGSWSVPQAFVGRYSVQFNSWSPSFSQYAYGKLDYYEADPIMVAADALTTVDDTRLPTGSLKVVAKDSITGQVIPEFGVGLGSSYMNTTTGEAVLAEVPQGTQSLWVSAIGYVDQDIRKATVVAGQQTELTVLLTPQAKIAVTVVDAATGAPLPGVCVAPVGTQNRPSEGCWQVSDAEGKLTLEYLRAGKYNLFAQPSEAPGYGAQWVGANRGFGRQVLAATITVAAGQTVNAPVVKMDRAGVITGKVTAPDGSPMRNALIGFIPTEAFTGELPAGTVGVDEQGNYTIDYAGPYDWPLYVKSFYQANQFSGGTGNSILATTAHVTVGQTTTFNVTLRAGVQVTSNVTGMPVPLYSTVYFYNAATGDPLGGYELGKPAPVVGPQVVRVKVNDRWYGGADFAHAKLVLIPASGSTTLNLAFS